MKLLFFTQLLPYPITSGGRVKTFKILSQLAKTHDITLLAFHDDKNGQDQAKSLERILKIKVISIYRPETTYPTKKLLKLAFRSMFSFLPLSIWRYRDVQMINVVKSLTSTQKFDCIYLDHDTSFPYLSDVNNQRDALIVYDEHNVNSIAMLRNVFEKQRGIKTRMFCVLDAVKNWLLEYRICKKVDKIACISDVDRQLLQKRGGQGDKMSILPLPFEVKKVYKYGQRFILFVGLMSWVPNKYGFIWFYQQIFPLIKQKYADVKLVVVGNRVEEDVLKKVGKDDSVVFTGLVDSVDDYYKRAGVVIVPIKTGGGIRIKLLEALALGMPVVSTTLGAEGVIDAKKDKNIVLLADNPRDFARSVIKVLEDKEWSNVLSTNASKFMKENYSVDATNSVLKKLLESKA